MNEDDRLTATASRPDGHLSSLPHQQGYTSTASIDFRILELEIENSRLHRLVAELLLKNQQLRKDDE
ncbi:MAG: hypothetical protein BGO25_07125 [Acidobacteriales bacterium 59-55]|nr:hypothetical protein [Terriglobales bacterium]OJV43149.1 MAG: hypothetical protein BGO25_07125 [Acidobacteriales bacterium 59-55]